MDMSFSPEHLAFRDEVRAFIREKMPKDLAAIAEVDGHFDMKDVMRWHKVLFEKGWVAPHWPKEFGGPGWDATRRFVFNEEIELSGAPLLSPFGLVMVGPLIMQFGSDAQKQRFLPKILSGEEVWCQGYSEPNAGSDLASLRTRGVLEGDHWVVNGQKIWTSNAHEADWMFALVRTEPAYARLALEVRVRGAAHPAGASLRAEAASLDPQPQFAAHRTACGDHGPHPRAGQQRATVCIARVLRERLAQ